MHLRYRVLFVGAAVAVGAGAGCSGGSETPSPTTIQITPGPAINFPTLNTTLALSARVLDQNGDSMPGQTVTWSSTNDLVASVNPTTGVVTAQGNGTAQITASLGDLDGSVTATVAQVAASIIKVAGDNQTAGVTTALPNVLRVRVRDAGSSPIANASVTFAVTSGGGTIGTQPALTDAAGEATTTWTLGQTAGTQAVSATVGALAAVSFLATGTAGPASAITIQAGDGQTGTVNVDVATDPAVRVTDQFNNPLANRSVTFTVTGGGGTRSPTNGVVFTNAAGIATLTRWTLGGTPGANTLSATVTGTALTVNFSATGELAGAPVSMAKVVGDNQFAKLGHRTNIRPAVRLTDAEGDPVAGVDVTFAVTSGGGSGTNLTVVTNANGIAQVGSWTVGGGGGTNTMTATATPGGIANNPSTFTATGQSGQLNIEIRNFGPAFSAAVQSAFDSSEAAWENILYGDLTPIPVNTTNACAEGQTINETVDDVIILVRIAPIDGPGTILGRAGPCSVRINTATPHGSPIYGLMEFDADDMADMSTLGILDRVILHEMGHVLGFNDFSWSVGTTVCIADVTTALGQNRDTRFTCPITVAMFDSIGGTSYTGGLKVPLENCVNTGPNQCDPQNNANGHWRELVFDSELMTPYIDDAQTTLLSLVSITTFEDMGYRASYQGAEPYSRVFGGPPAVRASSGRRINIGNDRLRVPVELRDESGRVVQVVLPR